MGRSVTPTFVVSYRTQSGTHTAVWNSRQDGLPTDANLESWRQAMNKSMQPGGANEHLSKSLGFILHVSEAWIRNQKTGKSDVAHAKAPMFEVI